MTPDFRSFLQEIKNSNLLHSFTNSTLHTDTPGTQRLLDGGYWPKSFRAHKCGLVGGAAHRGDCLTSVFQSLWYYLRLFRGEFSLIFYPLIWSQIGLQQITALSECRIKPVQGVCGNLMLSLVFPFQKAKDTDGLMPPLCPRLGALRCSAPPTQGSCLLLRQLGPSQQVCNVLHGLRRESILCGERILLALDPGGKAQMSQTFSLSVEGSSRGSARKRAVQWHLKLR